MIYIKYFIDKMNSTYVDGDETATEEHASISGLAVRRDALHDHALR